jgi:hypothetical protein
MKTIVVLAVSAFLSVTILSSYFAAYAAAPGRQRAQTPQRPNNNDSEVLNNQATTAPHAGAVSFWRQKGSCLFDPLAK